MNQFSPHIGKNVIETLTTGMYDDPRFIFREYIQNAVDQIDEAVERNILPSREAGKVEIYLSKDDNQILVKDNATGIKEENVVSFLVNVAASVKNPDRRKGFRGIGRLGGLAYCEKLIFETTYKGENVKSILTLDAVLLKKILRDKNYTQSAASAISFITSLEKEKAKADEHYFRVKLNGITDSNLFNIEYVQEYLSMVAPVPFNMPLNEGLNEEFTLVKKIKDYFKDNSVPLDEYNVFLEDEPIYKAYKNKVFDKNGEIAKYKEKDIVFFDVNFHKIENLQGKLVAILWYGVSNKLNFQLHSKNIERGIRLRKANIGVGSEITLSRLFSEERQNLNYIGELHAISPELIPNARRDYFNDSPATQFIEKKLKAFLPHLGTLTRKSSKIYSHLKIIDTYISNYISCEEKDDLTHEEYKSLKKEEEKAIISKNALKNFEESQDNDIKNVYKNIIAKRDLKLPSMEDFVNEPLDAYLLTTLQLDKLSPEEKNIVLTIYSIIDSEKDLTSNQKTRLKKKIAEHFN